MKNNMKQMKWIGKLRKHEDLFSIFRYICKPAFWTVLIATGFSVAGILFLLAVKWLEPLIVSLNLRYNAPVFVFLFGAFLLIQIVSAGCGSYLSLHRYKRPGNKPFTKIYPKGSSYKALNRLLSEHGGRRNQSDAE